MGGDDLPPPLPDCVRHRSSSLDGTTTVRPGVQTLMAGRVADSPIKSTPIASPSH
jgi:hypothetical protein